jgi:hypothetical protein
MKYTKNKNQGLNAGSILFQSNGNFKQYQRMKFLLSAQEKV